MKKAVKFNPAWPFPQYDKNGNRLMPPKKRQPKNKFVGVPDAHF